MKFSEIKNMNDGELRVKMAELKKNLFDARMKNAMGQLTNPLSIRHMRKDAARLRTALRQKRQVKG